MASTSELFEQLTEHWQNDTRYNSDIHKIGCHSAYHAIIRMGWEALPLIFAQMIISPHHWFWALREIVGTDEALGAETMEEATAMWLAWARASGIV